MGRKESSVAHQIKLDEAVARALQHIENKLATEDSSGSISILESTAEDEGYGFNYYTSENMNYPL